jgi:predicted aminopeptidase
LNRTTSLSNPRHFHAAATQRQREFDGTPLAGFQARAAAFMIPRAILVRCARYASSLSILPLLLILGGCETLSYFQQTTEGQISLLLSARPIEQVMADPNTSADLKTRLASAAAIRAYAEREFRLAKSDSYRSYVELGRAYPVWNVVATETYSLLPLRSWFPIAGCVDYRGFFSRHDAERYAEKLRARDYDVIVYGVAAYSTLGYFADPLLSSFVRIPEMEMAQVLFHELAHQLVYLKGDSTFSESFAVVLEKESARRWLLSRGKQRELASLGEASARAVAFDALFDRTRLRLEAVYGSNATLRDPEQLRAAKAREFALLKADYEKLKASWGGFAGYDTLIGDQPNNALLAAFGTYTRLVPAFEKLLAAEGGNLENFIERVKRLAAEKPQTRQQTLSDLLAGSGSPACTQPRLPGVVPAPMHCVSASRR